MKIVIIGATGLIGRKLLTTFDKKKYIVTVVTRNSAFARCILGDQAVYHEWIGNETARLSEIFEDANAVINLAGESIAGKRWTDAQKKMILSSRVETTSAVVEAINRLKAKPEVLIQASAIGIYGPGDDQNFTEASPAGRGFLAGVTQKWEETTGALDKNVRLVVIRTGIVLAENGGALQPLKRLFKTGFGGHTGYGKQWFSWIHIDDEVNAIRFLLENRKASGLFNLSAPNPVKMKDFCRALGHELNRPSWLHVPSAVIRLLMGQMGEEMLLSGQRVLPQRLLEAGYVFRYPEVSSALNNLLTVIK